ncbi:hypothetical protein [Mycobacterium decipiens]|uniref:hypothetical protein n=1 Tax=Mycobacterium decipiens TaxID=1430326 RepID=UPI001A99E606
MSDSLSDGTGTAPTGERGGSALVMLSGSCVVLLFGGLAVGVALGGVLPLPYGPVAAVVAYIRAEPLALHVIATAVFTSAIPLAVYAAVAAARLRQLSVTGSGAAIALVGGTLAAGALGLTGLLGWTLSRAEVSMDPALVRAIYFLAFLVGGPGHIVALGLLVAGMAVPALVRELLPRPLAWCGVAIAGLAELTTLVLAWPELGVILPIARVSALAWLVIAGALLPRVHLDPV